LSREVSGILVETLKALKFGRLGIICPIKASLMQGKTCIQ
jgi:hypothetical protein